MTSRPVHPADSAETGGTAPSGDESVFRGVVKHSLIYGIGIIVSRSVSFFMLPVYTRFLTPTDYGIMTLIDTTLDFVAIVAGGKIALGVFRFYHKTDDPVEKREVVATSFLLIGCLYTLIGTGVFATAGPLSQLLFGHRDHTLLIQIAAGNLAASSLIIVPLSFAQVNDYSKTFVGASLARAGVAVCFNVLFLTMGLGVLSIFLGSLIGAVLVGTSCAVWLFRRVGFRATGRWTGDLLRYGLPLVAMQLATFFATFADRFFLQAYADEAAVGLYGISYTFGFLLVTIGFTPMDTVWGPKRFDIARQDNRDRVLSRGFLLHNVLVFTVAVGITLYVGDALHVMTTEEFWPAARVVPLILVAYILQCWATVQDIGILVSEKTQYLTVANIVAALVAVAGYALLIPPFLEWGAAIATVLAFATRYGMTFWYSQRLWPVRYEWRPVWVLTGWSFAIAGAGMLLPPMSIVTSLAVRTVLVMIFSVGLWILPILDPEQRTEIMRAIRLVIAAGRRRTGRPAP